MTTLSFLLPCSSCTSLACLSALLFILFLHAVDGYSSSPSSSSCAASTSPLFRKRSFVVKDDTNDPQLLMVNVPALQSLGYPTGFRQALVHGAQLHAKRYWILDDSLSMSTKDGHFLMHTNDSDDKESSFKIEQAPCTRWNELQETCVQHAILALHLQIPTDFRLLNCDAGHFRIPRSFGQKRTSFSWSDVQHAQKVMSRAKPSGTTPLTKRLKTVQKELEQSIWPRLEAGQKVDIIIATDGLPTNEHDHGLSTEQAKADFQQALEALPPELVSVVIRLCTDDVAVVDYYNELEANLPHVQVLDDYWAEAVRVHEYNPWLNYGIVLHRVREMGCCGHVPLLKVLSQRQLSEEEVFEFCQFLFHEGISTNDSWEDLCATVEVANQRERLVWNPIRSQLEPWIDLDKYY